MSEKTKAKGRREVTHQNIHMIRVVERWFGKKRMIFWYADGEAFTGRASHMYALKHARLSAQHRPGNPCA